MAVVFFSLKATCQPPFDTSLLGAMLPGGYKLPPQNFENFHVVAINGKAYTSNSSKNKITFINFWPWISYHNNYR
jgi:hypothetical protein